MAIRGVVFDVGGVLEITLDLGVVERWVDRLELSPEQFRAQTADIWADGGVGTMTERQVHHALATRLGLTEELQNEMMAELWQQYLGTPNTELIDYAHRLRDGYRTGILSNSFVGAREREQAAYGLTDLVDVTIYSHEVGVAKPDPHIYSLICKHLRVQPAEIVSSTTSRLASRLLVKLGSKQSSTKTTTRPSRHRDILDYPLKDRRADIAL